jgi:hypothetical protein
MGDAVFPFPPIKIGLRLSDGVIETVFVSNGDSDTDIPEEAEE